MQVNAAVLFRVDIVVEDYLNPHENITCIGIYLMKCLAKYCNHDLNKSKQLQYSDYHSG